MPSKTPLTRSQQMARIRGRDTRPEMQIRQALWRAGLRYRVQMKILQCAPDLVFPASRIAVFIDGCFWHGCPNHYVFPRSRRDFWLAKLRSNVERDIRQSEALRLAGWRVVRLWEHEVYEDLEAAVRRLVTEVHHPLPDNPERWAVWQVEEVQSESRLERWSLVNVVDPSATRESLQLHRTTKWNRKIAGSLPRSVD